MAICAAIGMITMIGMKYSFGVIGENVTLRIRQQLYGTIIRKNIGFFDVKDNAPGVLSATMASDASTINGAASEGLASSL